MGSNYFKGGPNTSVVYGPGVQILRGSKYYVTDHNIISGVSAFVRTYRKMKNTPAPNTSIAYALHNFGKVDSKYQAAYDDDMNVIVYF